MGTLEEMLSLYGEARLGGWKSMCNYIKSEIICSLLCVVRLVGLGVL